MSNNDNLNSNDQIVDAIKEVIPVIYDDALKPVSKEVGKALGTLGKTVNMALAPVSAVVWGYEQIEDFVVHKVTKKLENISEKDIITPDATIAGPLLESLKYTGHKKELQEMYANLLASAMNKESADNAHPSFVEIIKQLTPKEATLIKFLSIRKEYPIIVYERNSYSSSWGFNESRVDNQEIIDSFNQVSQDIISSKNNIALDNLLRLKILHINTTSQQKLEDNSWKININDEDSLKAINQIELRIEVENKIEFTEFGKNFVTACIDIS